MIRAPISDSWFMMRPMATSLPGMMRDEKVDRIILAELELMRAGGERPSAARGSPCPPVAMIRTSFRGSLIASSKPIGGGKSFK